MQIQDKTLLLVGMLAAFLGCVADVSLLYAPDAHYERFDYQFLTQISTGRLLLGHYLGILAIPFELVGVWAVARQFREVYPRGYAWGFGATVLVLAVGVAYHGTLVFVGEWMKSVPDSAALVERIRPFFEPLGTGLAGSFMVLAAVFAYAMRGGRILPAWVQFFNPILIYLCLIVLYIAWPVAGRVLIVAGFNFSLLLFFAAVRVAKRGSHSFRDLA